MLRSIYEAKSAPTNLGRQCSSNLFKIILVVIVSITSILCSFSVIHLRPHFRPLLVQVRKQKFVFFFRHCGFSPACQ